MNTHRKIRVGIICGGKSAEHEVSLQSARNVYQALDKTKYEPVLIGITKHGHWLIQDAQKLLASLDSRSLPKLVGEGIDVTLAPERGNQLVHLENPRSTTKVDVFFPVLHGPFGEDGTIQGLLKLADVPFVGAGVLGSAIGMDKDVTKRLLREAGVPVVRFLSAMGTAMPTFDHATKVLGLPIFVKPANLGSSVGISKVTTKAAYDKALRTALRYDRKILLEEAVQGKEIECAVLGNEHPKASVPGEIRVHDEFYSYNAKYVDENGATLIVPAQLDEQTTRRIQELAVRTFVVLCCEGMARVDFFFKPDGTILVNEINTIPGFTKISMYPRLWEASGLPYTQLIDRLIQLARERHERERRLKTSLA